MKYKIELTGWEYHIQTKSLNSDQVEKAQFDINDIDKLEELHLAGNGDFETCSLGSNDPTNIAVYDEDQNVILKINGTDVSHYSEMIELSDNDGDKFVEITPEYSEEYENTLYLEKNYSGSTFYYEIESNTTPKKEDFLISYLSIGTPNGDIDLFKDLIFKSEILFGELQSGKHKGTYMNIFTSGGDNIEIS